MEIQRFVKHLLFTQGMVRRAFTAECLLAIERAIHASEQLHDGEVRFAVEGGLNGARLLKEQTSRERAIEVFSELRVWDTEHNNGVLIYVLLADQAVEIVADRGICSIAGNAWDVITLEMETEFSNSHFEAGTLGGIASVADVLERHFAPCGVSVNQLPDAPVLLT